LDFVSLLGGIVLGAAGAAIFDSRSGSGMLGASRPAAAPPPAPSRPTGWTVRVGAPEAPRRRGGYPVVNRIGGTR